MTICVATEFPPVSQQSGGGLVFSLREEGSLTIVYEAHRDFLSTPRKFIEVQAQLNSERLLATGGLLLDEEESESLEDMDFGVYLIDRHVLAPVAQINAPLANEQLDPDDFRHFLFYAPNITLEFYAERIGLQKTHYHHAGVESVLAHVLTSA